MDIWQNSKWLLTILILPNNHTCNSYVTKTAEKVFFFATVKIATINILRTFARKFSNNENCIPQKKLKTWRDFTVERWWVSDVRNVKKWEVTDFVLERTCPEEQLYLCKSGFVGEEGHSGCKSQNIAIRALKGNVLCQIWFKWTYETNLL